MAAHQGQLLGILIYKINFEEEERKEESLKNNEKLNLFNLLKQGFTHFGET